MRATYGETEQAIRSLLAEPGATSLRHVTPASPTRRPSELVITPESYLGTARLAPLRRLDSSSANAVGALQLRHDDRRRTTSRTPAPGTSAPQRIVAGIGARLRLHFHARDVYVVLGGRGTVHALVDGKPTRRCA